MFKIGLKCVFMRSIVIILNNSNKIDRFQVILNACQFQRDSVTVTALSAGQPVDAEVIL